MSGTSELPPRHTPDATGLADKQWVVPRMRHPFLWWALPAGLLIGALFARPILAINPSFWALTAINVVLSAAFVISVGRWPAERVAWLWAILGVYLIGSFAALFLNASQLAANPEHFGLQGVWNFGGTDVARSYSYITLAYGTFVIAAIGLSMIGTTQRGIGAVRARLGMTTQVLVASTALYVVATVLQISLGFGLYGTVTHPLPFHVNTVISFYRQQLYAAILLLCFWVFDGRRKGYASLCVGLIFATAFIEAYVSTSRGTLLFYGFPLVILWFITGRVSNVRKVLTVALVLLYLLLAPVLSTVRDERLFGSSGTPPASAATTSFGNSVTHSINRIGGFGQTLYAQSSQNAPSLGNFARVFSPYGLTGYFTIKVVGVSGLGDYRAPSLVGSGLMMGGVLGIIVVIVVATAMVSGVWRVCRSHFMTWPVATAVLTGATVRWWSDGAALDFYKAVLGAIGLEIIFRIWLAHRDRHLPSLYQGVAIPVRIVDEDL